MESVTTNEVARFPGLMGAGRLFSVARGLFALVGVAAVLAVALPGPRESLREAAAQLASALGLGEALGATADAQSDNVTAGTIQSDAQSAVVRDQRMVTEFIAKRYRVAQDAVAGFVSAAYRVGGEQKVDPLLLLAVIAVESRYNPVAESALGAKGLMQIIPKFHLEKLLEHGGEGALLDPQTNIQVGAEILREYLRRFGETETALQMYAGAFDEPSSGYAFKVLAERARLAQLLNRPRRA